MQIELLALSGHIHVRVCVTNSRTMTIIIGKTRWWCMKWTKTVARRGFLTRFTAALGLGGATVLTSEAAQAQAPTKSEGRWQGASHPEDAWYDKVPGIHRFVFDTISPEGLLQSMGFAGTFMETNKSG